MVNLQHPFFLNSSAIQPTSKPASQHPASQPASAATETGSICSPCQPAQPTNQVANQQPPSQPSSQSASQQRVSSPTNQTARQQRTSDPPQNKLITGIPQHKDNSAPPWARISHANSWKPRIVFFYQHTALSITLEKTASPQRRNNGVQSRNCGV